MTSKQTSTITIDPDAQCAQHGCARHRCDEEHALSIDHCPVCKQPAHASESNDLGQHAECAARVSGYHDCPCRDCFEIAIGCDEHGAPSLCHACESAGCDSDGTSGCSVDHSDEPHTFAVDHQADDDDDSE